jgi:hypothetical protein
MTTQERIDKLEKVIRSMASTAQNSTDFDTADAIGQSADFALELLTDLRADLEPEVTEEFSKAA